MNTAYKEFDVVVAGAGPGGLGAAIQAARNGAKVLLVEKNGYLGGNMTIGLPFFGFLDRDANVVMAGLPEEFMRDMRNYETAYGHAASEHCYCPMHNSVTVFDYELFKIVALRKVLDAGVELLLHCDVESVNVENKTLKSITLMGKGYRITVAAKVFIDGTGDGDMAYLTGASFEKGQKDTGVLQPSTLMFNMGNVDLNKTIEFLEEHPEQMDQSKTMEIYSGYDASHFRKYPAFVMFGMKKLVSDLRAEGKMPIDRENLIFISSLLPGEVHLNCTRHLGADGSDVFSLTRAEVEGYLQVEKLVKTLQEHVPGFENGYITQIYPSMGIRESRRFSGIRTLTEYEVVNGVINEETIGIGGYPVDIHNGNGAGTIFTKTPPYGIPYGITVSDEINGLMFAGRCASMDAVAMSSARVMGTCMTIGEAAGVGAALAVKYGIEPKDVNVQEVRDALRKSGVIVELDK